MKRYSTDQHHMDRLATAFIYAVVAATLLAMAWPA
jgi:hypothetical protein